MNVPFVDLQANFERHRSEFQSVVDDVLDSGWYIGGEPVERFEERFADYIGVDHAVGVASGTDAIRLTLEALEVGPADEVATVSHTFVSSVDGVVHNEAAPKFVDINPKTYTMDPEALADSITDETEVVLPVHLYGQPADIESIRNVAAKHDAAVVEDACQAHGASYEGERVGGFGTAACFSFYPTKNLGAYGDGGAVVTDDDELAARLRNLREYGKKSKYRFEEIGYNSRLDTLQAAILNEKLNHLNTWNADRRSAADRYDTLLRETPIKTPVSRPDSQHVYHLYVVRARSADERDALESFLEEHGVGTGIHYPVPVHEQESYSDLDFDSVSLPVTEQVCTEILSLPMFPELTEEQQLHVADVINEFYGQGR
jgi:dTDP-4-amino-4,6-dideoxygalactose transaminase